MCFLATRELPHDGDATIELSAAWRDLLLDVIKLDETSAAWRDLLLLITLPLPVGVLAGACSEPLRPPPPEPFPYQPTQQEPAQGVPGVAKIIIWRRVLARVLAGFLKTKRFFLL